MLLLLGATGYLGTAFRRALEARGEPSFFLKTLSRRELDYTDFKTLLAYLRRHRPKFLINAAGFTGKPNVDACETARADTLLGNTLLPQTISQACALTDTPWGHVSSGCIYQGAMIADGGGRHVERDLMSPAVQQIIASDPARVVGFTEDDEPNFSFRHPPCSFYSGTKALAEEILAGDSQVYIWRLRIPFDEFDHERNYLSKLQRYERVYDNVNSLSHRGECVEACVDLWRRGAPFGVYNVTNPGFITARRVAEHITKILRPARPFTYWRDDAEFYERAVKTPRSNCVLDVSKILATGIRLRPVEEAVIAALESWSRSDRG